MPRVKSLASTGTARVKIQPPRSTPAARTHRRTCTPAQPNCSACPSSAAAQSKHTCTIASNCSLAASASSSQALIFFLQALPLSSSASACFCGVGGGTREPGKTRQGRGLRLGAQQKRFCMQEEKAGAQLATAHDHCQASKVRLPGGCWSHKHMHRRHAHTHAHAHAHTHAHTICTYACTQPAPKPPHNAHTHTTHARSCTPHAHLCRLPCLSLL